MPESLFMYSPGAFTAYQDCTCEGSRMVSVVSIEDGRIEGDTYKATMVGRSFICSVCETPYRLMVDTRKVGMITGLAE